jgi:hypothetical protein
MGHRDYKTTLIYADYARRSEERQMIERAFGTAAMLGMTEPRCER